MNIGVSGKSNEEIIAIIGIGPIVFVGENIQWNFELLMDGNMVREDE